MMKKELGKKERNGVVRYIWKFWVMGVVRICRTQSLCSLLCTN